jgi:hypothetical protein
MAWTRVSRQKKEWAVSTGPVGATGSLRARPILLEQRALYLRQSPRAISWIGRTGSNFLSISITLSSSPSLVFSLLYLIIVILLQDEVPFLHGWAA